FTFGESVTQISPGRRREIRRAAEDAGVEIVGLHWLLASPKGLHIHTRDEAVRRKTVDYLKALVDFAGDVGAPVMVFGSPAKRRGPAFGDTAFRPIAAALRETGDAGYVSVEVFDYSPDPETIARESLRYLREVFAEPARNAWFVIRNA